MYRWEDKTPRQCPLGAPAGWEQAGGVGRGPDVKAHSWPACMHTHTHAHALTRTRAPRDQEEGEKTEPERGGGRETRGVRQSQTWAHLEKSRRKEREAQRRRKRERAGEQRDRERCSAERGSEG